MISILRSIRCAYWFRNFYFRIACFSTCKNLYMCRTSTNPRHFYSIHHTLTCTFHTVLFYIEVNANIHTFWHETFNNRNVHYSFFFCPKKANKHTSIRIILRSIFLSFHSWKSRIVCVFSFDQLCKSFFLTHICRQSQRNFKLVFDFSFAIYFWY